MFKFKNTFKYKYFKATLNCCLLNNNWELPQKKKRNASSKIVTNDYLLRKNIYVLKMFALFFMTEKRSVFIGY